MCQVKMAEENHFNFIWENRARSAHVIIYAFQFSLTIVLYYKQNRIISDNRESNRLNCVWNWIFVCVYMAWYYSRVKYDEGSGREWKILKMKRTIQCTQAEVNINTITQGAHYKMYLFEVMQVSSRRTFHFTAIGLCNIFSLTRLFLLFQLFYFCSSRALGLCWVGVVHQRICSLFVKVLCFVLFSV